MLLYLVVVDVFSTNILPYVIIFSKKISRRKFNQSRNPEILFA